MFWELYYPNMEILYLVLNAGPCYRSVLHVTGYGFDFFCWRFQKKNIIFITLKIKAKGILCYNIKFENIKLVKKFKKNLFFFLLKRWQRHLNRLRNEKQEKCRPQTLIQKWVKRDVYILTTNGEKKLYWIRCSFLFLLKSNKIIGI